MKTKIRMAKNRTKWTRMTQFNKWMFQMLIKTFRAYLTVWIRKMAKACLAKSQIWKILDVWNQMICQNQFTKNSMKIMVPAWKITKNQMWSLLGSLQNSILEVKNKMSKNLVWTDTLICQSYKNIIMMCPLEAQILVKMQLRLLYLKIVRIQWEAHNCLSTEEMGHQGIWEENPKSSKKLRIRKDNLIP